MKLLAGLFVLLVAAQAAPTDSPNFLCRLEASPQNTHTFIGYGILRFNNVTNVLSWTIYHQFGSATGQGARQVTGGGIRQHIGVGQNGPYAHQFTSAASPIMGSTALTTENAIRLFDGTLYVAVHSNQKEDDMRCNITHNGNNGPEGSQINHEYGAELTNDQVDTNPQPAGGPSGGVALVYTTGNNVYVGMVHNVANPTLAHFHKGRLGQTNGTAVVMLICDGSTSPTCNIQSASTTPVTPIWGPNADTVPVALRPPTSITSMLNNRQAYINIHSTAFGAGETRGQVTPVYRLPIPPGLGAASSLSASFFLTALLMTAAALFRM